MKRSMPLRNSGFAKSLTFMDRDQRIAARSARMANMAEIRRAAPQVARGVMGRVIGCAQAVPKPQERRNAHLLAMAKGMPCLLRISGVCNHRTDTTVACHSNSSRHGKAGARKADDHYTVWGCSACHRWLDQGPASAEEKIAAFERAHREQRLQWAEIAHDPFDQGLSGPRDRKAARWALDQYITDTKESAK